MNDLKIFENPEFGMIRTMERDGEPWFIAADVCRVLEINNSRMAVSRIDADEKGVISTDTLGGKQEMTIINEPGIYTLVLGSRKPEAKRFKRWITHEVIPSIRKHGAYMTGKTLEKALTSPDFLIQLATQLKEEQEKNKALTENVTRMRPKEIFADSVANSHTSILVGELAKILKQNGVNTGEKRLFEWLRNNGYLIRRNGSDWNMPTQRSMDAGLFTIKETAITHSDGHVTVSKTVKVTGKGQQYFINKFLKNK